MEIILYKYSGESNRISKILDDDSSLKIEDANFNREYNIINPIIRMVSDADLTAYNYLKMNGIYYFVDSMDVQRSNAYVIRCQIDVLMTYKDVILKQTGRIVQSVNPLYMSDASIPYDSNVKVKRIDFPKTAFDADGCFVLIGLGVVENG